MKPPAVSPPPAPSTPAAALIARLHLEPIPQEGGWFVSTHVRAGTGPRPAATSILALVTTAGFSAFHRLDADETWHFHDGSALELHLLHPDGRAEARRLGVSLDAGQFPQVTVPAGTWMAARPADPSPEAYTLFGCTMSPGFDPAGFALGERATLLAGWPAARAAILALTRDQVSS